MVIRLYAIICIAMVHECFMYLYVTTPDSFALELGPLLERN